MQSSAAGGTCRGGDVPPHLQWQLRKGWHLSWVSWETIMLVKWQENLFPKDATVTLPPDLCRSTLQAGVGTNPAHAPPSLVQPPPRKQCVQSLSSNKSFQFGPYHRTSPSALSPVMLPALSILCRCCLGLCPPGAAILALLSTCPRRCSHSWLKTTRSTHC